MRAEILVQSVDIRESSNGERSYELVRFVDVETGQPYVGMVRSGKFRAGERCSVGVLLQQRKTDKGYRQSLIIWKL